MKRVFRIEPDGTTTLISQPTLGDYGAAVAAPNGDLILASSSSAAELVKINASGSESVLLHDSALVNPRGMAFGPDGKLYISDKSNDIVDIKVWRLDLGDPLNSLEQFATIDYGVDYGWGGASYLAFGPTGDLFVSSGGADFNPYAFHPPGGPDGVHAGGDVIRITSDGTSLLASPIVIPTVIPPLPAPEPATLALLGLGLAGFGIRRRKQAA